jgi:nifR3 family TIM-barrel protein
VLRAAFAPGESPRSIQLYGTDPADLGGGVAALAEQDLVDHIDLNFGCPAPKVTRLGGGAALPWRINRFAALVASAVEAAGGRPVTVKMRMGIDPDHLTYLEAGRVARDAGAAAVTLHARTAYGAYSGHADWDAIGRLVEAIGQDVPVLGNGDIWEAADAIAMIARTGCAGVVVGRGCLGRPWLFRDLEAALRGEPVPPPPTLGEIAAMLGEHAGLLVAHLGEFAGMRDIRKHTSWYLQGFELGKPFRLALRQVERLDQLQGLLRSVDSTAIMPEHAIGMHRGHTHGPKPVRLPHGWLDDRFSDMPLHADAAGVVSGG